MKKINFIIVLILILLGITSCNINNGGNSDLRYLLLGKSNEKLQYNYSEEYTSFKSKVSLFGTDLSEKIYNNYNYKYDQMAISPLSIYMALAMTSSIATDEAQHELANMLGMNYEEILLYTKYLYSSLNKEFYTGIRNDKLVYKLEINNSIWMNDLLSYKISGLELLRDNFYVDSYKAPFTNNNQNANKAIKDYVYRSTKGLINSDYNFDVDTLFLLINTLYLKDAWNSTSDDLLSTSELYKFLNKNGDSKELKLLLGKYIPGSVQIGDGFEYFYTTTCYNLKLYFIKPTTKTLDEVYHSENLYNVLMDKSYDEINHELKEEYFTRCLFPEFDASFNEDIVDILKKEYGISKIFRENVANYNKVTDEICYTSNIIHQTKLTVNKKGIEGAAVTIVANAGNALPNIEYTKLYYDFIIDKSFGFMIVKDDVVLFSGVVNNL